MGQKQGSTCTLTFPVEGLTTPRAVREFEFGLMGLDEIYDFTVVIDPATGDGLVEITPDIVDNWRPRKGTSADVQLRNDIQSLVSKTLARAIGLPISL